MFKCPNCGTPDKEKVKVCEECGEAFASQDLHELHQAEYLLDWLDEQRKSEVMGERTHKKLREIADKRRQELQDILVPPKPLRPADEIANELELVREIMQLFSTQEIISMLGHQSAINLNEHLSKEVELLSQELGDQKTDILHPTDIEINDFILDSLENWHEEGLLLDSAALNEYLLAERAEILNPKPKKKVFPFPELIQEEAPAAPEPLPVSEKAPAKPLPAPKPPKEKIPFDQWLLSERNIKFMLYSGAGLLILAGLIFIGVNWNKIPGEAKFVITFFITGLTYLGGFLLYQRPQLKAGGNALLGIASGFFVLNFVVLQIYVFQESGLRAEVMWLIASPFCLGLYLGTAYWTKSQFFTYLSIGASFSLLLAALVLSSAFFGIYSLAFSILLIIFLWLSYSVRGSGWESFTYSPLKWTAQIGMPLAIAAAWVLYNGWSTRSFGTIWLLIITQGISVLFYAYTDFRSKSSPARWATSVLFTITLGIIMVTLNFTNSQMGLTFFLQAFAFLGLGYWLEQREDRKNGSLPFYLIAYALAALLTFVAAIDEYEKLAKALVADVLLIGTAAYIHPKLRIRLTYLAAWLFMVPAYMFINIWFKEPLYFHGLLMGVLGVNYAVAGYFTGRNNLQNGAPFLTASAFLSVLVVFMTWGNHTAAAVVLLADAVLYVWAAIWLGWVPLLLPGLTALSLVVIHVTSATPALIISLALLGNLIGFGGYALRRIKDKEWSWPLYLVGSIDLVIAYTLSFIANDNFMIIGLSAELFILLFIMAWLERDYFEDKGLDPILSYIGIAVLYTGFFYVLDALLGENFWRAWPPFAAAIAALFAIIAWALRGRAAGKVYELPFRLAGLGLMIVPIIGSLINSSFAGVAISLSIATVVYLIEAGIRDLKPFAFIGVAGVFISHYFILRSFVTEPVFFNVWPIYTLILTTLFVLLYRLLDRWQIGLVYVQPLKYAGLSLILVPAIGWFYFYHNVWSFIASLITISLIYLTEAHRTKLVPFAYLGVAAVFIVHFFILDAILGQSFWNMWPIYTVFLTGIFTIITRQLQRWKLGQVFVQPLKYAGLGLTLIPLLGAIEGTILGFFFWFDNLIPLLIVFLVTIIIYLTEAARVKNAFFVYLGIGIIYVAHALLILYFDLEDIWPIITAGLTALFAAVSWILYGRNQGQVFVKPFRYAGLGLMIIPLFGASGLFYWDSDLILQILITVAIATAVYSIEAIRRKLALFAYIAVAGIFSLHYFIMILIFPNDYDVIWPPITAAVTALFAVISWQFHDHKIGEVFEKPFYHAGLGLMLIPIAASIANSYSFYSTIVYAIAAIIYLAEGRRKNSLVFGYIGVASIVVMIWSILFTLDVTELQAYVFPLGVALLGASWYQRTRVEDLFYQPVTILALAVFLGSAFYQSLPTGAWGYALLLTIESIAAVVWGIRQKSRGYVLFGGVALLTNAIVQLGPAFIALSGWIQLGIIGSILLTMGLVALFKREEVLATRQKITEDWRSWNS